MILKLGLKEEGFFIKLPERCGGCLKVSLQRIPAAVERDLILQLPQLQLLLVKQRIFSLCSGISFLSIFMTAFRFRDSGQAPCIGSSGGGSVFAGTLLLLIEGIDAVADRFPEGESFLPRFHRRSLRVKLCFHRLACLVLIQLPVIRICQCETAGQSFGLDLKMGDRFSEGS